MRDGKRQVDLLMKHRLSIYYKDIHDISECPYEFGLQGKLLTDLLPAVLQLLQVGGIPLRALETSQVQSISVYTNIFTTYKTLRVSQSSQVIAK